MPEPATIISTAAKTAGFLARFLPWTTVKRHNRLALREHENLVRWARDDLRREGQALDAVAEDARERGVRGGLARQGERQVRTQYAERWRNRKSEFDRALEDLRDE